MAIKLYPWQQQCIEAWFNNHTKGSVHVVTGAGKTMMAIAARQELLKRLKRPLKTYIVVPKDAIARQWYAELKTETAVAIYSGTSKCSLDMDTIVFVINSARYTLARLVLQQMSSGSEVLIIADEYHHDASPENRKAFAYYQEKGFAPSRYHAIALSATPPEETLSPFLHTIFGEPIYTYTFDQAIDDHIVNTYNVYHIGIPLTEVEKKQYDKVNHNLRITLSKLSDQVPKEQQDREIDIIPLLKQLSHSKDPELKELSTLALSLMLKRKDVINLVPERITCTLDLVAKLPLDARIIIFSERIATCETIREGLQLSYPGKVSHYQSTMEKEAKELNINRFKNNETRILVACRSLDEGFDVPSADVAIVLSSSRSSRQRIQRLGRILRRSKDKRPSDMYYLFMEQTVEASSLLENTPNNIHVLQTRYTPSNHQFDNPLFDALADTLLTRMEQQGVDQASLDLMDSLLVSAQMRSDFLLPTDAIRSRLADATTLQAHNYWLCIQAIHALSEQNAQQCV